MIEKISIEWCIGDVKAVRPDLTKEQCSEVLQAAEHYHDASIGISWDVLESHADTLCPVGDMQEKVEEFLEKNECWGSDFETIDKSWKRWLDDKYEFRVCVNCGDMCRQQGEDAGNKWFESHTCEES